MVAVHDDLGASMDAFQRCIEDRDAAAAERLLHPDFALELVHPTPLVVPRALWFKVLPDYVVHEYTIEERVTDVAGDVAAVLQRVRMRATVSGEDRSGPIVISDVWRRGADGWQLWRRHSTPFEAGRLPGV